jgi:phage minor structural protein
MEFTFLKGNDVAFFRSDAQTAEWTQEEMNVHCTFPLLPGKIIERGMILLFQDPATNDWQAFNIRQCKGFADYQQIETESIAITELSACHVPEKIELDNVTAQEAINSILPGTGWNIGSIGSNPVSSGDLSRGSVWQNISTISSNWNVLIVPRVTVNASGIVGRFLDLVPATGVDRGLRLAVNKNVTDPCVTYDDSELCTALYGYGGTYSEGTLDERITLEYNFSEVVWNKTSDHPAKPAGQRYLEYPEMTAIYGVNGKPRFGYYQNTNINDPAVLLQKTWETLKNCCEPKISITGTATDLKRLGYADVPLRLYDMAIIEVEPLGLLFYKQVVKLTVNLLDPSKNLPTVGDYIPNIIFINRETESFATGGGRGSGRGGGGKGMTKLDEKNSEYETGFYDTGRELGAYARKTDKNGNILEQAGMDINPETGVIIYAEGKDNMIGAMFHVQKNMIEAEVHDRTAQGAQLSSRITQTANQISLEVSERKANDATLSSRITVTAREIRSEVSNTAAGLSSRITQNANKVSIVVDDNNNLKTASIVAGINGQEGSYVQIDADKINLTGYVTASQLAATNATIDNLTSGRTTASSIAATTMHATNFYCNNNKLTLKRVKDGNGDFISLWGIP